MRSPSRNSTPCVEKLDSSLEAIDVTFPDLSSSRLLVFLVHIEAIDVPDNIFWSVAEALTERQDDVARQLPRWLRELLPVDGDGRWDDFKFRQSLKPLWQYGLIQSPTGGGYTHISLHAFVRWKAKLHGQEKQSAEPSWDIVHALFHASAVRQIWIGDYTDRASADTLAFIRRNAPGAEAFLSAPIDPLDSVLDLIGEQYEVADRNKDARNLYEALLASSESSAVAPKDPRNLIARRANLMVQKSLTQSWAFHDNPFERSIWDLVAVGIGDLSLSYHVLQEVVERYLSRDQYDKAEEVFLALLKKNSRIWDSEGRRHSIYMWGLARTYMAQERWDDAEIMLKEIILEGTYWAICPDLTYLTQSYLFQIYEVQGRRQEAEELRREIDSCRQKKIRFSEKTWLFLGIDAPSDEGSG